MTETSSTELVKPGIETAIRHFAPLYTWSAVISKFIARGADPHLADHIGPDAMRRKVALWWRDAAETWNARLRADGGRPAEVYPRIGTLTRVVYHLKASAAQRLPRALPSQTPGAATAWPRRP